MSRLARMGTAETEVLLQLTRQGSSGSWSYADGKSLYENRALTGMLCERLALRGHLSEELKSGHRVYTVTKQGRAEATRLRRIRRGYDG